MRKAITRTLAGAAALALSGTAFGGISYAGWGAEGNGTGGTATNNCVNVGIPILSGTGLLGGQGVAVAAQCNATANGTGG